MTQRRIYQNEFPYFVTFRTMERYPLFEKTRYVRLMARVIFKTAEMKHYDILAFQIMPDHVHILAYTKHPRAHPAVGALKSNNTSAGTAAHARRGNYTISDLIHGIKSYYCGEIRRQYGINYPIFQRRFYTRIVNTIEYMATIIEYIINNPIKENLPKKYHIFPYQYFHCRGIRHLSLG